MKTKRFNIKVSEYEKDNFDNKCKELDLIPSSVIRLLAAGFVKGDINIITKGDVEDGLCNK